MSKPKGKCHKYIISVSYEVDIDGKPQTFTQQFKMDPNTVNMHQHPSGGETGGVLEMSGPTFLSISGMIQAPPSVPISTEEAKKGDVPVTGDVTESSKETAMAGIQEMLAEAQEPFEGQPQTHPLTEGRCSDFNTWLVRLAAAQEQNHELENFDDPMTREIGFIDVTAHELLAVGLVAIRKSVISPDVAAKFGKEPKEIRQMLTTFEGRSLLVTGEQPEEFPVDDSELNAFQDILVEEAENEKPVDIGILELSRGEFLGNDQA